MSGTWFDSSELSGHYRQLFMTGAGLARDVSVSSTAINDWISVFEASNQRLLEPYFENIGKRLIKSPKLYFSDTGLLCFLLGLDERSLTNSPYLGALWETAVFAELRKLLARSSNRATLWFYRDAQQREVDFALKAGNTLQLVDAKWTENPTARDGESVERVARLLAAKSSTPDVRSAIVCRSPHPSLIGETTAVIDVAALDQVLPR